MHNKLLLNVIFSLLILTLYACKPDEVITPIKEPPTIVDLDLKSTRKFVQRNDKNEVKSSKFVKEFWVEVKNGSSIVLAASKQLDKDFDPETTVIREILTVSF